MQLVPGAGELDRPDPLRVAPRELVGHAAGPGSPAGAEAPQGRFHGVRLGVRVPTRARGYDRRGRAVDGRARLPLAELSVHREVRVAGPH